MEDNTIKEALKSPKLEATFKEATKVAKERYGTKDKITS